MDVFDKLQKNDEWPQWKYKVQNIIQEGELMDYVTGKILKPLATQYTKAEDYELALAKFNKNEFKAQRVIEAALGKEWMLHAMDCANACEMWTKLESIYGKKSKVTKNESYKQFFQFKMESGDSMAAHVSKLQSIIQQLEDGGETVSKSMIITSLLLSLPPEFSQFKSSWYLTATDQTAENLISKLMMEEIRIGKVTLNESDTKYESKPTVMLVEKDSSDDAVKLGEISGKAITVNKSTVVNGFGYEKCIIVVAKKDSDDKDELSSSNGSSGNCISNSVISNKGTSRGTAHIPLCKAMMDTKGNTDRSKDWYLDSGGSNHMTYHDESFDEFQVVGVRDNNCFQLLFKVVVNKRNFSMKKETESEGNSESIRRWVESSDSRQKSVVTTRGNASCKVSISIWHEQKYGIDYEDGSMKMVQSKLYGLKQAARNTCVFDSNIGNRKIVLAIFIDVEVVVASHKEDISNLIKYLTKEFEIKVSDEKYFIGLEIDKWQNGSIYAHAEKDLGNFGMMCVCVSTPDGCKGNQDSADSVSNYPFHEAVGSLICLKIDTRPYILFAVGRICRCLENPTESDVNDVKRIFKCLRGTIYIGMLYESNQNFVLNCFSYSDYAGNRDTRGSTTGYVLAFGSYAISWWSILQKCVTGTDTIYVSCSEVFKVLVWLSTSIEKWFMEYDSKFWFMDKKSKCYSLTNG